MLYTYACKSCGQAQDHIRTIPTRDDCPPCEVCGGETRRMIGATTPNESWGAWDDPYATPGGKRNPDWDKGAR